MHASRHPAQDELRAMCQCVRPKIGILVYGEGVHMRTQADSARAAGASNRLVGRNNDPFMIPAVPGMRRQIVEAGRLRWQKKELGYVAPTVW